MTKPETSFMKKYILSINPDELLFDLFLVLYAEFFLYKLVTGGKLFVEILSMNALFVIGVFIDFFVLWYIGMIFRSYRGYYKKVGVFIAFFVAALWILVSLHLGMAKNVFDLFGKPDLIIMSVFGYLMVVVGIGGGIVFAGTEYQMGKGKPTAAVRLNAMKKLLPISMWAMNIYIVYHLLHALDMKSWILGIGLWAVMIFLEFYPLHRAELAARRRPPAPPDAALTPAARAFYRFVFPVIIVTLLCLWNEIYLWGKLAPAVRAHETVSIAGMIFYLVLTGIIPMRLLLLFKPPLNAVNLLAGAGSMGCFIYSIVSLVSKISS
ncbi:MAG TPA: hypothetical protein PLA65_19285 [Spirochaetota bacterium]|nr:hypothetical protein [Spirochaetota bacterium]HOD17005.1 hypothetical protein [Spirochaetota bacterium]HPG51760.1 hypothetical protein [Spirochaetota bacterium]HPN14209.1 hypothetical protein [Spirochaetota bacterium]